MTDSMAEALIPLKDSNTHITTHEGPEGLVSDNILDSIVLFIDTHFTQMNFIIQFWNKTEIAAVTAGGKQSVTFLSSEK